MANAQQDKSCNALAFFMPCFALRLGLEQLTARELVQFSKLKGGQKGFCGLLLCVGAVQSCDCLSASSTNYVSKVCKQRI